MKCKRPFYLDERALLVPCGKCTYCRIARRREWTLRILHELQYWKDACFITLTYSDEHLPTQPVRPVHFPVSPSLSKGDFQKFFKRLRRRLDRRLRYYGCGEYGEQTSRPHYHAIVFGVSPLEEKSIEQAWALGHVDVGFAEPDSISYVAQYIDKKRYGEEKLFSHYGFRQPEFQAQSLGIGKRFLDERAGATLRRGALLRYAKEIGLPRYYRKRLMNEFNSDVRALDIEVFLDKTRNRVEQSQIQLAEELELEGLPYRDMDDDAFRMYVDGLFKRNQAINQSLVAKGKIKNMEKKL